MRREQTMKSSYNSFLDNIEVNEKELQRDLQKRKNAEQRRRLNKENEGQYIKPQKKPNPNRNNVNQANVNKNTTNKNTTNNTTNKINSSRPTTTTTTKNPAKEQGGIVKSRDNSVNNSNTTTKPKTNQQTNQNNVATKSNTALSNVRKEKTPNVPSDKQQKNQKRKEVVKIENTKGNVRKVTQLNNVNGTQEARKTLNKENDRANVNNNGEQANSTKHRRHITKQRLKNEKIHIRQRKINTDVTPEDNAFVEKQTFTISKEEYDEKILGTIKDNQTKMIFLKENQKLAKVPKSVAFLGIYTFILSAIILYSFSRIGTVKVELRELNKQFNELNEINAQLNIKLATAYNIDNIRQRAENELYMNKPEAHQIMYITVVPENNVEYEMGTNDER